MRRGVDGTTAAPIVRWHLQLQQQRCLLPLLRRCGASAIQANGSHTVVPHQVACRACASSCCGSRCEHDAMASLRGLDTVLCTRRWLNVETNRYLQEQQEYIPSVCEAAEEVLARLDQQQDDNPPIEVERFFHALHADALVAMFEYFVTYRLRSLFRSSRGSEVCGCEVSPLCELLLTALSERSVELSSKHVAFIGTLYSASGLDARLFLFILYHSRHSLRRTQAVQALRTISVMRLHAVSPTAMGFRHPLFGTTTSVAPLFTSAMSSVMVRCMELEQTHDGYDVRGLLSKVLMRHYSRVQPDVRTACLWWVHRGLHKKDHTSQSAVLEVKLNDAPSPVDAFSAMETASRLLTLPAFDAAHLRSLVKKGSDAECSWRASNSRVVHPAFTGQEDSALVLHQKLPTLERLHGELKLLALETLSQRVLEITQLDAVAGVAEVVLRYCPSLSEVVLHRMLQLACLDSEGAAAVSTLTAMHRLLPHVNVMDVIEGVMMCGACRGSLPGCRRVDGKLTAISPPDAFVKCLAMHLPSSHLPVMFHRLCRQRDLAAFRLSSFVLRVVLQALEYASPDSLSCEDVTCIRAFIQQEQRKAVLHCGRTVAPKPNGEKAKTTDLEENRLLADIEACVLLRCCSSNVGEVSPQLPPKSSGPVTDSCKAVGVAKAALTPLFGARATKLVTTEAAMRERAPLVWLYAVYRMSVSIMCELEALAALAVRQGVQLRLNGRQRTLVELSESVDESLILTDVHPQVPTGSMDLGALRACIEDWLLNKATSGRALQRLVTLLDEDDVALASFLCYAAIARHDFTAMEELRRRASVANVIFYREGSLSSGEMYTMPLRSAELCAVTAGNAADVSVETQTVECHSASSCAGACSGGSGAGSSSSSAASNRGGDGGDAAAEDADTEQGSCTTELTFAARCALRFANTHWESKAPAVVDAARLWAQLDIILLEGDCTRKVEYYEAMLRLCQKESLAGLAERVPADVHREMFAVIGGKGLWTQGVALLRLAESSSGRLQIPVVAYQQVMRACLMHRVPVPAFLRERSKNTVLVK
ncbi:hypothetical protein TRSC58_01849 [Trypanosoma rangeli SC58]|uniref:Uncharacterized protein n=1 Tax=Trypanosoma rangeli SC58 TaxID=429131 RepID=A0A061J4R2_TRYRA|nr:hypothetical protein TRSC58_01849 [Trypanosoma rangeli SC58]